ncbi:glycosyltransferase family 2 protein, partial [Corynebacterium amycolatum]
IVQSLQLLDRRIRILDGEGRGPGAARNIAIQQAHGEFLAFADADDLVLPGAYRAMLQTLEQTGSDFVFGGYIRHKGSSVTRPQIVEATHSRDVLRADASDFPEAFNEPVLWNK